MKMEFLAGSRLAWRLGRDNQFAFQWIVIVFCSLAAMGCVARADGADVDPEAGYRFLIETALVPADLNQEIFDQLWTVWEEPSRSEAETASVEERRAMSFRRYGLTPRPGDDSGKPLQYVVDEHGGWHLNCFGCHGGAVQGQPIPGAPNANFALELFTSEVRHVKLKTATPFSQMDIGSMFMPLGKNRGTTNAVMFGVALLAARDADLNRIRLTAPPEMTHHDMDAPPWWNYRHKDYLYIDGFAPVSHRSLMQFALVEQNGPEHFRAWEENFRDVDAYLRSLRPPAYPGPVDQELAARGQRVYRQHCAECHGTSSDYPERRVPIEEVGTDRLRLDALSQKQRALYAESWFAGLDADDAVTEPDGYVAPPLDGVWASAPYFHNGSVPTLWHVLHPESRLTLWKRDRSVADGYDHQKMGLAVTEVTDYVRRGFGPSRWEVFDTRQPGKSAAGHDFPNQLNTEEKRAVLEYLKTR